MYCKLKRSPKHSHALVFGIVSSAVASVAVGQHLHGEIDPSLLYAAVFSGNSQSIDAVSNIGDIDGNGRDDLAFTDLAGLSFYTAYTPSNGYSATSLELENITGAGGNDSIPGVVFRAESGHSSTPVGSTFSIRKAGDLNADGVADVIIGDGELTKTYSLGTRGGFLCGTAYLVYGNSTTSLSGELNLGTVGTSSGPYGARFFGETIDDWLGSSVAGVGDVNGDGIDDIVIGSSALEHPQWTNHIADDTGAAYIVYGVDDSVADGISGIYNISGVGSGYSSPELLPGIPSGFFNPQDHPEMFIFPLDGAMIYGAAREGFGTHVAGGDVNDDGLSDILVGTSGWDGGYDLRQAYLINGQAATSGELTGTIYGEAIGEDSPVQEYRPADVNNPLTLQPIEGVAFQGGSQGQVDSTPEENLHDAEVHVLGDINGDGVNDFAVGVNLVFGLPGDDLSDAAEVIEDVTLVAASGSDPAMIHDDNQIKTGRIGVDLSGVSAVSGFQLDTSISPAGDFNGDGLADFIAGNVLIYGQLGDALIALANSSTGQLSPTGTDLGTLGSGVDGIGFDVTGFATGVGDINGDGLSDVVVYDSLSDTSYLVHGVSNALGDLNSDGEVDLDDYDIIAENFTESVTPGVWALGDIVPDGIVNANDFNLWANYYQGGGEPIPEPSALVICGNAVVLLFVSYYRQRR